MNPFKLDFVRHLKRMVLNIPRNLVALCRRCQDSTVIDIILLGRVKMGERDVSATMPPIGTERQPSKPIDVVMTTKAQNTASCVAEVAYNVPKFEGFSKLARKSHVRRLFADAISERSDDGNVSDDDVNIEATGTPNLFYYDSFVKHMTSQRSISFFQDLPSWTYYNMTCVSERDFDVQMLDDSYY